MLDPWQERVLTGALSEAPDGRWAASEVGLVVPRQNGKGAILEARELAGLFLFGERQILHSAHEFKTAKEAYQRIRGLIESTPDLDRQVKQYRYSNEEVSIELHDRRKLRFVARSSGSGRGFTGDCIILDEAYNLSSEALSALLPTMAAVPNYQLWYTSSAPLPRIESDTLRRLCKRGRAGSRGEINPGRLGYFEWCADPDTAHDDLAALAQANPALGHRITEEFCETERGALEPEDFARERLGIFPEEVEAIDPVLAEQDWKACTFPTSKITDPLVISFEVSIDRKWSVIAAASLSSLGDGKHVELIENRRRTGWVVDRLIELRDAHQPLAIVCNPAGPAGALLPECERKGLVVGIPDTAKPGKVDSISGRDYQQACGAALDEITEHRWRHLDDPALNAAVAGAAKRTVGDAMVFDRRGGVDISPLTAVTVAAWAVGKPATEEVEPWFALG